MRKLLAFLLRLSLALALPLVAGCLDIHEEYWFRADGSARAEFRYTVPAKALLFGDAATLERQIREAVAEQPGLHLDAVKVNEEDGRLHLALNLSTDSIQDLVSVARTARSGGFPSSAADLAGNFDVKLQGLQVDFSRKVQVGSALGMAAIGIGREDRQLRQVSYIVHLPVIPRESNADRTEDGGRTLIWRSSLGEALQKPIVTRFRARIPLRPEWIGAASGAAILLTGLAVTGVRRLRRSRGQGATQLAQVPAGGVGAGGEETP